MKIESTRRGGDRSSTPLRPAHHGEVTEALTLNIESLQEELGPEADAVAGRLLDVVQEGSLREAARRFRDLTPDVSLDAAWTAVAAVHRALDRAASEGVPASEVQAARERLTRAERELARAYLDGELRAYREMLRDISHDIRSPLNSILFLTDGLYKEQSGPLSRTQERQLGIIYSAAASLLNFVNDILDFARAGGDEEIEGTAEVPFSIDGVCRDVERLVGPLVANRKTDFGIEVEARESRRGDPQLLCRVLVNLLSNAVEAAEDEGWVRCQITEAEDDSDWLVVEVADDGWGAEIDRLRAFVEPRDEREMTRMLQGRTHGLGLQICSRLIRSAEGDFRVVEREGGGTRFIAELPFPAT